MAHFVVVRDRATSWDWSLPMRAQRAWNEHAAFMDALAERGVILAGGPLGPENEAARVLHIFAAGSVAEIEAQLAEDPWTSMGLLSTVSIEPWTVLLGGFAGAKGSGASPAK